MRTQQQLGSFFEQLHPMFVPPATSIQVSKSLTLPNKLTAIEPHSSEPNLKGTIHILRNHF